MADPRINLYHNLSVMLEAGVPIARALKTVHKRGRIGRSFRRIAEAVSQNAGLAEAVDNLKQRFDPLDVALIRTGEDTGELGHIFKLLSQWYDFRQRIKNTVLSGLILPILLIHVAAILVPVPQLALGGWDFGAYVQSVIYFLAAFYIPAGAIAGILFLTPRRGPLRAGLDTFILMVPVLGKAVRDLALSRYCKIFGIALKAGMPIFQAASLALDAVGNAVVRRAVRGGTEVIRQGNEMSAGFSRALLPAEFIAVWEVGEETGNLDESAIRLGGIYADHAERGFQASAVWFPRLIYFLIMIVMVYHILKGFTRIYGNLDGFMEI